MRSPLFLALLSWAALAQAQTYKCVDDRRQFTYSNIPCEKQGLRTEGTVTADRVTTMPSSGSGQGSGALPTKKLSPPVEMPKDPEKNAK